MKYNVPTLQFFTYCGGCPERNPRDKQGTSL